MDKMIEIVDNYVIPFILTQQFGIGVCVVLFSLLFSKITFRTDVKEKEESNNLEFDLDSIRNYIENIPSYSNEYKVLQSIILPKKGDYVEINQGRWKGYVARITNILEDYKYNLNVSIKDNINYGSDIPPYLLKEKERSYFKVLTDREIDNYELLDEEEYFARYALEVY